VQVTYREPAMTGLVDWAAGRARMVIAFILLSLVAGGFAYVGLPKEGEPDIEIPALFVSVPFPGISAEDAEKLLVEADGGRAAGPRRADHR
jgi:multidrug efflux pump